MKKKDSGIYIRVGKETKDLVYDCNAAEFESYLAERWGCTEIDVRWRTIYILEQLNLLHLVKLKGKEWEKRTGLAG
jgi:hypothetical protein